MNKPSAYEIGQNVRNLQDNTYPGSLVIMGMNELGTCLQQVVCLMHKDPEVRNRKLELAYDTTGKFVRTVLLGNDTEPSDTYPTMQRAFIGRRKVFARYDVVSTGDNTSKVAHALTTPSGIRGEYAGFTEITHLLEPEDNAPHFTPRVTGVIALRGLTYAYEFSARHKRVDAPLGAILPLKKTPLLGTFESKISPGIGLGVHTNTEDGMPIPPFDGMPVALPLKNRPQETAELYWNLLNPDYRIAIAVKSLDRGPHTDYHIINAIES